MMGLMSGPIVSQGSFVFSKWCDISTEKSEWSVDIFMTPPHELPAGP